MGTPKRTVGGPDVRARAWAVVMAVCAMTLSGCSWEGPAGLPLPGAAGSGGSSYQVTVELPNVLGIQDNSQVMYNDVPIGSIADVKVKNWHASVTARIVDSAMVPANVIARIGQTSLLGTLHLEFDVPAGQQPSGRLAPGTTIPLDRAGAYPSTEETLSAVSVVLNGGGFAELAQIQREVGLALQGSQTDNRVLISNLVEYTDSIAQQTNTIVDTLRGVNRFAGEIADAQPALDRALAQIPAAITVLSQRQKAIVDATVALGSLADNANQIATRGRGDIADNLAAVAPALRALGDSGRNLTRSLSELATYPWPENKIGTFIKGDYANLSATIDLTLSRLDQSLLIGTPYYGSWTALEAAMGRKTGIMPMNNYPLALRTKRSG